MPIATDDLWTAEMARALPDDGNRYEVVRGELLVTPAPRAEHQLVAFRLGRWVADYCDLHQCGFTWMAPADISWGEDSLVQPDVFVVPRDEALTRDWRRMRTLKFVAEVLSPKTAKQDRFQKRILYQTQGVDTIWLIDAKRRFVEIWTPGADVPRRETELVAWHPVGAPTPLVIDVARLFA